MSITNGADIASRYTYRVTWSAEDQEYVATCLELPSLSWLADTQEGALGGLRELVTEAVQEHLSLNQYVVRRLTNAS